MSTQDVLRAPLLAAGCALVALAGCSTTDPRQVEIPEKLGAQIAVLALEVPAGSLKDGETATFDIDFQVGWRGNVERSSIRTASRPDLQDAILAQHRQWIYAVATRAEPCAAQIFAGMQRIGITRTDGRLSMMLEPARVEREIRRDRAEWISSVQQLKPESVAPPQYPRDALLAGAYGTVGVMFEFGPDGKARDVFSVNVANDRFGMTKAAVDTVARYELKEPPGRNVRACQTFQFTIR